MTSPSDPVLLRARAALERSKREVDRKREARREGRKRGKLSSSLEEKLRACNPLQLRRVKRLCDAYLEDHRRPPEEFECRKVYTRCVLETIGLKNKRYQLELRDCGRHCRTCPHGPYLYSYFRDGGIIKLKYHGRGPFREVPRKVLAIIRQSSSRASHSRAVAG